MIRVDLPLTVPATRDLHVGDRVSVFGTLYTARTKTLDFMADGGELPFADGSLVYHCGPIGQRSGRKWTIDHFAPDHTSVLDTQVRELFVRTKVRGVIGRGELGPKVVDQCRQLGTCYLQTIGGASVLLADRVKEVKKVHLANKFDNRDAVWEVTVEDFPAIVMIDSHGQSLYEIVRDVSTRRLQNLNT